MIRKTNNITPTEMIAFYQMGVLGKLELRNWLGEEFPTFKKARRQDVDQQIEQQGIEALKAQLAAQEFEPE